MLYSVVTRSVPKLIFTRDELDIAIGAAQRTYLVDQGYLKPLKRITKAECYHADDIKTALELWRNGEVK